jgi:hypothetical protein
VHCRMKSMACILHLPMLRLISNSFDADPPLPCNDEDLGELGLDSPAQSPTEMCSFIALTKLTQILAFALRTLVSCTRDRLYQILTAVAVLDKEFKGRPWLRWETVGTTYSCHARLSPEQMGRYCPRTSCASPSLT